MVLVCPVCCSRAIDPYQNDSDPEMTPLTLGPARLVSCAGKIVRCRTCRLGFRRNRPSQEQLAGLYENLDSRGYDAELEGRRRSARAQLRILQRYVHKPGRLLDVGCASGLFLKSAVEAGWQVEGVEPAESHRRTAMALLGGDVAIHASGLEDAALAARTFDVVTLWDVLEHVPEPVSFLSRAASLLKRGGFILANVPNLDSLQARLLRSKWPLLLPEHLNYFNRESLHFCGTLAGLNWLAWSWRPAYFSLEYVLFRLRQHELPGASMMARFIGKTQMKRVVVPIPLGEICGVWRTA